MKSLCPYVLVCLVAVCGGAGGGCGFLGSQTKANLAATCQRSCANVPADTQGDCQTRCQNK